MGHVARRDAVEVGATRIERIPAERARDLIDDLFDDHHALRATETAEGGVGYGMGPAAV